MALWAPGQGSVGLVKGRSINIDGYHNPNNVRKGWGGGGGWIMAMLGLFFR